MTKTLTAFGLAIAAGVAAICHEAGPACLLGLFAFFVAID